MFHILIMCDVSKQRSLPCSNKDVSTWLVSAKLGEVVAKHEHKPAAAVEGALAVKADKIFAIAQGGDKLCILPLQGAAPLNALLALPTPACTDALILPPAHAALLELPSPQQRSHL